ncbi:MAG: hypothetical protein NTY42_07460, partial [Planctomycetota bacterium]|nr:hypothetical protein [Planctomycetota bacterium]
QRSTWNCPRKSTVCQPITVTTPIGIRDRVILETLYIWSQRIKRLHEKTWVGRFLSASRDRLREFASRMGVRHFANIG